MSKLNTVRNVICIFILCLLINSCVDNKDKSILRITVNSWVGFGPLYVAKNKNIFKNNDLNVEILKLENAPDRRAALLSKRIEIVGSTLDDLAVTLSQGVDAIAFSVADYSNGGDGIIVAENIENLNDLISHPIAVQPGFVNHFFLLYVLKKNGVPTNKLIINPMTPDDAGAAFLAGSIDAAVTWEPFLSEGITKRRGSKILITSASYPEAIVDVFIARKEWFESNKEIVRKFRKSWDDSIDYIEKNKEESFYIISQETGIDAGEVGAMLSKARLLKNWEFNELFSSKIKDLTDNIILLWKEAGYIDKDIDLMKNIQFPQKNNY